MAIIQTGNIFKGLEFDGVSSRTYGVYISGDAAYNAPERDVEMIDIPGRDGSYAYDKGRFQNITVTYPAGIFGDTESDFADGISDFRNAIAAKKGYKRLTDEYNPDEYRMAVYRSGLDVTPAQLKAGQFEIVFDCMPQRFLTSGETATAVASGGTITNPTLFDAKPLLSFKATSTGSITIGGKTIGIKNDPLGTIVLANSGTYTNSQTITIDNTKFANGDPITVSQISNIGSTHIEPTAGGRINTYANSTATGMTLAACSKNTLMYTIAGGATFTAGTSSTVSGSASIDITFYKNGVYTTITTSTSFSLAYNGSNTFTVTVTVSGTGLTVKDAPSATVGEISVVSSKSALSGTLYIDLDLGTAWADQSGNIVDINNAVTLPADLPVLAPGVNTITYTNVNTFKVTPRWWKV